ncbi:MAG: DUF3027 domain-containing protein [Actinobacteria bacterium]|nr:DUF3027 domain-containing protein [Actinomycetota bacterium]
MKSVKDIARKAVLEVAPADEIGDLLTESTLEDFTIVSFKSAHPGYVGWHWSVSLHKTNHTVNEVWMEPSEASLIAKAWVPWSERIQPGDLSPGDLIATPKDDPRLTPGYVSVEELDLAEPLTPTGWSVGLGRERVLSHLGIDDAVDRWREGENGPRAALARYAEHPCSSCGWLVTIGGSLGQAFGVCANAISPSDGRIVSMDHGCGAHSQTIVEAQSTPVAELVIDELAVDDYDFRTGELPVVEEVASESLAPQDEPEEVILEIDLESEDKVSELDESHEEDL